GRRKVTLRPMPQAFWSFRRQHQTQPCGGDTSRRANPRKCGRPRPGVAVGGEPRPKLEWQREHPLPERGGEQLARVRRAVRSGLADSMSGYIARVLEEHQQRESLHKLV